MGHPLSGTTVAIRVHIDSTDKKNGLLLLAARFYSAIISRLLSQHYKSIIGLEQVLAQEMELLALDHSKDEAHSMRYNQNRDSMGDHR